MNSKKLIAGNWKMNKTVAEALALVDAGRISDAKSILAVLWVDRLRRDGTL